MNLVVVEKSIKCPLMTGHKNKAYLLLLVSTTKLKTSKEACPAGMGQVRPGCRVHALRGRELSPRGMLTETDAGTPGSWECRINLSINPGQNEARGTNVNGVEMLNNSPSDPRNSCEPEHRAPTCAGKAAGAAGSDVGSEAGQAELRGPEALRYLNGQFTHRSFPITPNPILTLRRGCPGHPKSLGSQRTEVAGRRLGDWVGGSRRTVKGNVPPDHYWARGQGTVRPTEGQWGAAWQGPSDAQVAPRTWGQPVRGVPWKAPEKGHQCEPGRAGEGKAGTAGMSQRFSRRSSRRM